MEPKSTEWIEITYKVYVWSSEAGTWDEVHETQIEPKSIEKYEELRLEGYRVMREEVKTTTSEPK